MNRLSTLSLFVGCLALVSRGAPVFAPSAGLAQEEGQIEATANEDADEPDSGDEGGGTVSDPHGSAADDASEEDEPGTSTEERNGDEHEDETAGTDEAASRSPAEVSGSLGQDVVAL
jgi:hypothetical protein